MSESTYIDLMCIMSSYIPLLYIHTPAWYAPTPPGGVGGVPLLAVPCGGCGLPSCEKTNRRRGYV